MENDDNGFGFYGPGIGFTLGTGSGYSRPEGFEADRPMLDPPGSGSTQSDPGYLPLHKERT